VVGDECVAEQFEGRCLHSVWKFGIRVSHLLEQSYGRMDKAHVVGRFQCVVEPFVAPDVEVLGIPVMIIEVDNDPLVESVLREQLKATYPGAAIHTLNAVGNFPYFNDPDPILNDWMSFSANPKHSHILHFQFTISS